MTNNTDQGFDCAPVIANRGESDDAKSNWSSEACHSDEFWVEMLKLQNKRLLGRKATYSLRNFLGKDQKQQDIRKADMRLVIDHVWRSYDDPKRAWLWSLLMFTITACALVPAIGPTFGFAYALFTVSLWIAVHRVRRI